MKKIFSLLIALVAMTATAGAQGNHGAMTFAGKSNFYVTMMGNKTGETDLPSDTLIYSGSDFTLPSMTYNDMVIPSFEITGTTFTGGYGGVTWEDQTFSSTVINAEGEEKTINGSSLKGTFTHADGIYKLQLEVTFTYGSMPFPITYSIESYYVKDYSGENNVTVGGQFGPYKADVTYRIRTYIEDETTKMDVEVPSYELSSTVMGDLTLGSYTVKGLTFDDSKGGFYKDYASDGLTMHFTATSGGATTMDDDYPLAAAGAENILVELVDGEAVVTNNFKPGSMPFQITAVMNQKESTDIKGVEDTVSNGDDAIYNLQGQRVAPGTRGIVIKNGRKYFVK